MSISRRGGSWRARYYGPDGRQRNKSFQRKSDADGLSGTLSSRRIKTNTMTFWYDVTFAAAPR